MAIGAKRRPASRRKPFLTVVAAPPPKSWANEALAVFSFALTLFLLVSLVTQVLRSKPGMVIVNPMGPVGQIAGTLLFGILGYAAVVPVICAAFLGIFLWRNEISQVKVRDSSVVLTLVGVLGLCLATATFGTVLFGHPGGGSMGALFARPLTRLFSSWGAGLFAVALLMLSLALTTRTSVASIALMAASFLQIAVSLVFIRLPLLVGFGIWRFFGILTQAKVNNPIFFRPSDNLEPNEDNDQLEPKLEGKQEAAIKPRFRRNEIVVDEDDSSLKEGPSIERGKLPKLKPKRRTPNQQEEEIVDGGDDSSAKERQEHHSDSDDAELDDAPRQVVVKRRNVDGGKLSPPEILKVRKAVASAGPYEAPPLSLLAPGEFTAGNEDDSELAEKSRQIEAKLRDFAILGKVTQVHPGPVITLFEFEPAPGVKVGRIAALQDDLAMSLKASSIRIIAPIPKRGSVGIEVPNRNRDLVRLRDVLESEAFIRADSILSVPLGKDTYGDPVVVDIASMPHLLIAGATGTGKSVCINSLLVSLLYRASPQELGLILIDPKILELSIYEGIPHLRVPVVTHPKQARGVLQWAIQEMDRRYRMMQRYGVRNIDGYNRIAAGVDEDPLEVPLGSQVVALRDDDILEEGTVSPEENETTVKRVVAERLEPLPKLVIVIDELADLMLSVGRDIEELITRLAQKARASGIHLIVATQRPSVDVITGLIKANFPARLSFRVSSRIDSRTILDQMGSEKLLGRGDMLFMQPGAEAIKRMHGAFVADGEVKKVVDEVRKQGAPQYDPRIMSICEKALEEDNEKGSGGSDIASGEYDAMYDKALELVIEKGQASTSMIQRAFRIGYNRAARIVEQMEKDGIVGPMDGAKPREVIDPRLKEAE